MSGQLSVLKFGGSVLREEADLPSAVAETQRFRRESGGVVVVVSAFFGLTDQLLERARQVSAAPDPGALALLAATGELASVSLVTLALRAAGVPALPFDATQLGLQTKGGLLEADPCGLASDALRGALDAGSVAVVPGFVGRDAGGAISVLGRGGSDLSAVFIADQLHAQRVRLIKDVDGIFDRDPALPGPPARRFDSVTWEDAIRLGGDIVQERCLRYAQQRGIEIEVAAWGSERATRVGSAPSCLEAPPARVDVALPGRLAGALA